MKNILKSFNILQLNETASCVLPIKRKFGTETSTYIFKLVIPVHFIWKTENGSC